MMPTSMITTLTAKMTMGIMMPSEVITLMIEDEHDDGSDANEMNIMLMKMMICTMMGIMAMRL